MALIDTDKILGQIYFNPGHIAGFKSKSKLQSAAIKKGIRYSDVSKWLQGTDSYTKHRPLKRKFQRQKFVTSGVHYQWQADLADMSQLARENDSTKYLLCVIDTFSRKLFIKPLKSKSAQEVTMQFSNILSMTGFKVRELLTDRGAEFYNVHFKLLLQQHNIKHFSTFSQEIKAALAERAIKTLKSQIYRYITHSNQKRYIDHLQDFVKSYNDTVHSALGMSPNAAESQENSEELWQKLYNPDPPITPSNRNSSLKVGDKVRLSKYATVFRRGFLPNWSDEIFVITKVRRTVPTTYYVKDQNGQQIQGAFYKEELQQVLVRDNIYKIEKIISKKRVNGKTKLLVRWQGYGPQFDSYIDETDLIENYKN